MRGDVRALELDDFGAVICTDLGKVAVELLLSSLR